MYGFGQAYERAITRVLPFWVHWLRSLYLQVKEGLYVQEKMFFKMTELNLLCI
jgi:hypothetical protein